MPTFTGLLGLRLRSIALAALSGAVAASAVGKDGDIGEPVGGTKADPPWGEILFVNGRDTKHRVATEYAALCGSQLGYGVRLVWNNHLMPVVDDIAILTEKLFDRSASVNAATDSLYDRLRQNAEAGRTTWVVAHSAGALCVNNAMRSLNSRWRKRSPEERQALLSRIRIVTVGSAVFDASHTIADGWPKRTWLFDIFDAQDNVAQWAGSPDWDDTRDGAHSFRRYVGLIEAKHFAQAGFLRVRGDIVESELIRESERPEERGFRIRIEPPGIVYGNGNDKSVRTMNFRIPREWKRLRWTLDKCELPDGVRLRPMLEDAFLWFDEPAAPDIRNGGETSRPRMHYLRVFVPKPRMRPFEVVVTPTEGPG